MTKSDLDPALESGDSKKVEPPLNKDFDIESLPEPQQKWLREYTSQLAAANEELQKEIAARKQTELLLRESEELYRVTLSYVSDAVFLTDDTGRFTFVCPNVEEIFGYNYEEVLEMGYISRLIGTNFPFPDNLSEYEVVRNIEHTVYDNKGRAHVVLINLKRVTIKGGTLLFTMREITARKKLIKENKRLTAQFYNYQKLQSVGRLAEGIAHDFNNMLSVIQMNIDLVRGKLNPMDTTYLKIQQISLATEHAAALTHQLLAFSRNEVLLPSIFNLNNLINNLNPMLDSLFSSNIVLSRDLQEDLWLMKGDASQLEQVILNLSFNASDAMPQGGRLLIKTSNVPRDALSSHADPDLDGRPWILFEVLDTGSGIDPVTIRRIFEPFFTTKEEGTGLGLATTQRIVAQNGGKIVVESSPGEGTSFKIYLPPVESPTEISARDKLDFQSLFGEGTILLVEDENSLRQLVGETLREYGYHVLEASDSESGIGLARKHDGPINLLLTDFSLPLMDGRQLYKQLSAVFESLRVLYMSGYSEEDLSEDEDFGPTAAFLQKPFTIEKLLTKVRQALE